MKIKLKFGDATATFLLSPTHPKTPHYKKTKDGDIIKFRRMIKFDKSLREEQLKKDSDLYVKLLDSDIEYDLNLTGKIINRTYRIKLDKNFKPVYKYEKFDIRIKPDGKLEERKHKIRVSNIKQELPVVISEKAISYPDFIKRYVLKKSYNIIHEDEGNFDLIYNLAKDLHEKQQLRQIFAFNEETLKPEPLIITHEGTLYNLAFLQGIVDNRRYCLRLLLSDMELRWEPKI
ncbi:MAG: hypothetical protein DRO88_02830 [Promethearchaeia archaeon]|nr:MAG: hypothetical protein DRO88_02830 [Candidatus Lokiarchaeia archaeon]